MPRLARSLLREARASHVLLPSLLRECRDLPSARNELRWLREHAYEHHGLPEGCSNTGNRPNGLGLLSAESAVWKTLKVNVSRRATGVPLQYIMGTQPFGNLEILCREGVLIPRPETEAYTTRLASILENPQQEQIFGTNDLRILDLCSGTGCISLLLHSLLKPASSRGTRNVDIVGIDLSDTALALAQENLQHNVGENLLHLSAARDLSYRKGNVFDLRDELNKQPEDGHEMPILESNSRFDILVANPPYISRKDYLPGGTTTRSVRKYEPKLALVPDPALKPFAISQDNPPETYDGDTFYRPLLDLAQRVQAKIVILETGDHLQALRVRQMAIEMYRDEAQPSYVEVWDDEADAIDLNDRSGRRARSVAIWTREALLLCKSEKKHSR